MDNEDNEYTEVIRTHNRALRKVHKQLRNALQLSIEYNDNLFMELCKNNNAESSLEKLWMLGGLNDKCSPQDYDKIVELLLEKLNVTIPIDQRL